MSQQDLGMRMKVSRTYFSKIERNGCAPTLGSFLAICEALRFDPAIAAEQWRPGPEKETPESAWERQMAAELAKLEANDARIVMRALEELSRRGQLALPEWMRV